MSTEDQAKADTELLERHVNQLAGHFDTVQILVTRVETSEDKTRGLTRGGGNWFARYGQMREWMLAEEARMKESAVRPAE